MEGSFLCSVGGTVIRWPSHSFSHLHYDDDDDNNNEDDNDNDNDEEVGYLVLPVVPLEVCRVFSKALIVQPC